MNFLTMAVVLLRKEIGLAFLTVEFGGNFFAGTRRSQASIDTLVVSRKIGGDLAACSCVSGCFGA